MSEEPENLLLAALAYPCGVCGVPAGELCKSTTGGWGRPPATHEGRGNPTDKAVAS